MKSIFNYLSGNIQLFLKNIKTQNNRFIGEQNKLFLGKRTVRNN